MNKTTIMAHLKKECNANKMLKNIEIILINMNYKEMVILE